MTILDQHGLDVLEGLGVNRDTATAERALIIFASTSLHPVVDETDSLTLVVEGTFVASAMTQIDLYYATGY